MAIGAHFGALKQNTDPYLAFISDYTWGSNATKSNEGGLFYDTITFGIDPAQEADAARAAERYVHYLHGVNPFGLVYLSNMNEHGSENSVNEFYHSWFTSDSKLWDRVGTSTYGPRPASSPAGPTPATRSTGAAPTSALVNRAAAKRWRHLWGSLRKSLTRISIPAGRSILGRSPRTATATRAPTFACSRSSSMGSPLRSTAEPPPMQQASRMRQRHDASAADARDHRWGRFRRQVHRCGHPHRKMAGRLSSPGVDAPPTRSPKTESESSTKRCRLAAGVANSIRECRLDLTAATGIIGRSQQSCRPRFSKRSTPACRPPTRRSTARPRYSNTPASSGTAATSSLTSSRAWETSAGGLGFASSPTTARGCFRCSRRQFLRTRSTSWRPTSMAARGAEDRTKPSICSWYSRSRGLPSSTPVTSLA